MKENQNKQLSHFWEQKSLEDMTLLEWESICDGCGLCCLTKLQDDDTEEIVYTRIVCDYSDLETGHCRDYANRSTNVPTCVQLTRERVAEFDWLPDTCAYRMLYRGQPLADWHPLLSGSSESLKKAGVGLSAIEVVVNHTVEASDLDYEDFVIDKP
ncbi:MAG TPA: YcgN family cysteine cluster protein [Thiomicrorhabdus sp.]|nr:YcgN family cysteine cluster protein [Thiomicrorhabdus sp.]